MSAKTLLIDAGTSYAKILDTRSGERRVLPSRQARAEFERDEIAASTGHVNFPGVRVVVNELVALAEGGLALIDEPDFTLLDCGARDVKYVKIIDRKVVAMDWNTECGAFTGQVIELLTRYFDLDGASLPGDVEKIPVTCGILGMTNMFDLISRGESHEKAFARFLKGIAFNCEILMGRPDRLHLSGGLCENRAFVESFTCEAVPLGRFVLLDGLRVIVNK